MNSFPREKLHYTPLHYTVYVIHLPHINVEAFRPALTNKVHSYVAIWDIRKTEGRETNRVESDIRYFDNLLTQFRNFRKSNDELSVQSITAHSVWPYKNPHKYFP